MDEVSEQLDRCLKSVRKKVNFIPKIALVLGSGLGGYAENIRVEAVLDYGEIEKFPTSSVPGHKGRFVFGWIGTAPVVCMQGRVHYYEGYSMQEVVLPIRLMKKLGAEILILTNAAGGVNVQYQAGDFMLIRDHIASFVPSPLIGKNPEGLGLRFPDMSDIYDKELRNLVKETAKEQNIPLQEGVYLQMTGPAYESPAEVKLCRTLGADAVGMSTACEAVAANHMGMKLCGISCISNLACGMTEKPLSHTEVQEMADQKAPLFEKLLTQVILKIAEKMI